MLTMRTTRNLNRRASFVRGTSLMTECLRLNMQRWGGGIVRAVPVACAAFCLLLGHAAWADETSPDSQRDESFDARFGVGLAAGLYRFNSTYQINEADSPPLFVGGEGTIGLDETNVIPIAYGTWNITNRHSLGFSYFSINRDGSALALDEQIGDFEIDGILRASDDSDFYYLNYGYSFLNSDDRFLRGLFGVYTVDLDFRFDAMGDITIDGEPLESGMFSERVTQVAPLPMVGVQFGNRWSERWVTSARVNVVGGSFSDYTGVVVETVIAARRSMTQRLGLVFGWSYFDLDLDIKSEGDEQNVSYGYDGVFLGLDLTF